LVGPISSIVRARVYLDDDHNDTEDWIAPETWLTLANVEYAQGRTGPDASAAGVLLYPEVHPLPTLQYQYGPHRLTATGVDLTQDWRAIHQRLLEIVPKV
jgi:hypothetical protein